MSSLKFSVQKKQHRERSQPSNRSKWGLLEKHKDYVLRAKDYHVKQDRLKILREKAESRNPDEFYHGMHTAKTNRRGIEQKERESAVSLDVTEVKLLKTQDEGYIVTMIQQEKGRIERLQDRLAFVKATPVEDRGQESDEASDYEYSDDEPQVKMARPNKTKQIKHKIVFADSVKEAKDKPLIDTVEINKDTSKRQNMLLRELNDRKNRLTQLQHVLHEVQLQRQLMANGPKKKIVKSDGSVTYKWKAQRKK
ncbi:small-subunit processome [Lipomyces arxii]|uniref:small-subunit processome n=1 Tax=Lipomyces arxii TaxID=56418 RepID=UPI0034D008A5